MKKSRTNSDKNSNLKSSGKAIKLVTNGEFLLKLPMSLIASGLVLHLAASAPVNAAINTIQNPEQAKKQGLDSLRVAVRQDGGVPIPENLDQFIKSRKAALQLGKALFWDMQIGSDGVQACASCHFHAGADSRSVNQLNPNRSSIADQWQGDVIGYYLAPLIPDAGFEVKQPNGQLTRKDFPFVKTIQDLDIQDTGAVRPGLNNSNDVSSSMGVFFSLFNGVEPGVVKDLGSLLFDPIWNLDGKTTVRRVEPRNTPSVINAVFNYTNFWEGRANPKFNGQSGFGDQDPNASIGVNILGQGINFFTISLGMGSLASQAVSPLASPFEMSYGDFSQNNSRRLEDIGKKILGVSVSTGLSATPLVQQKIHPRDSLLRELTRPPFRGLATTYADLVKAAFQNQYWDTDEAVEIGTSTYSLMESNFSLFFGLSVALYESTLVSDQTPFDRWMETGRMSRDFGKKELAGLNLFVNEGQCIKCHSGPELTSASVRSTLNQKRLIRPMKMGSGSALYDNGFYNISVTPTTDDIGRGDMDPSGLPLAFSRQALFSRIPLTTISFPILGNDSIPAKDEDQGNAVCDDANGNQICDTDENILPEFSRVAVDGAFKTPGLRNVELTGPYFHNGGVATLKQVVQFYNRGGNFCHFNSKNLAPTIKPLGLTSAQEDQLVAFLLSLTDERVRYQQRPFDHPELRLPADGLDNEGQLRLHETGAYGHYRPLKTFLNLNPFDPIYTPDGTCVKE